MPETESRNGEDHELQNHKIRGSPVRNLQMKCVRASYENTKDVTCYKAFLLVMATHKKTNPKFNVIQKSKLIFSKKSFTRFALQSECWNFNQ